MLESLITSNTRIKLLLKFFLNRSTSAWLRSLADEFNESTNAIRIELNRFEQAGLLKSEADGNKKVYTANTNHPLYDDIHNILLKHVGIDQVIENVIKHLGNIVRAWLGGEMALGRDSHIIDIILIGENIDRSYLLELSNIAEQITGRRIRTLTIPENEELNYLQEEKHALLLWEK